MSVATMTTYEMQDELESVSIEDELNDFMADLLSERQNEAFLHALFWAKPGAWQRVSALCIGLGSMLQQIDRLEQESGDYLSATWLEYPDQEDNEGFCLIVFFAPMLMWSNTAIYNKALLLRHSRRNGVHH